MRVPIEAAPKTSIVIAQIVLHHPLKMRVPIEAVGGLVLAGLVVGASPSENEGPY